LEEQMRVATIVAEFAKRAVNGCPCKIVLEKEQIDTKYHIDRDLSCLTFESNLDRSHSDYMKVDCPLFMIESIYSLIESGEGFFPVAILSAVKSDERDQLLMLSYRSTTGEIASLFIIEEPPNQVEQFCESVRILCVSATPAEIESPDEPE
jgi:hypothetical protein